MNALQAAVPASDMTLADAAIGLAHEAPDHLAVVDAVRRMTRSELLGEALRLGSELVRRGLRPGAALAFQLPNWHEACVLNLAAVLFGFKLVPLLPMYREAELGFILNESPVEAIFLPQRFRNLSYPDLFSRLVPAPIAAENVFIVRGADPRYASYQALLHGSQDLLDPRPLHPDAVKVVLYTSGSTGQPKAVQHTDRSLRALIDFAWEFWGLSAADVALVPSPLGHIGGSMYAFEFPWRIGMTAVLMDLWSPERAMESIDREGVTFCAGATPFLADLVKAAEQTGSELPSLRRFICGGASVPSTLIEQAAIRFRNCTVSRAYGSTELPLICPGIRSRTDAFYGATTDGECATDVKILGEGGDTMADGDVGEIVARAPRMFVGYLNAQDNEAAFTPEGYFRTGDLGRIVAGKFLEIKGRKKDIIIRLGENISPLEIENVLAEHPAIKQVAIVGIPDDRTGEAALAFVVLHQDAQFNLTDMREFLSSRGLAKQKFPEHLRIIDGLPTNSIGKVLKRELQRIALT
jgi:acyl-CoA synthetase (AMP-forming)/AMP-acid ligase II